MQFLLILKNHLKIPFLCLFTDIGFISPYFYVRSFWWSVMISLGKTNQHRKPYFHSTFLILSTSSYCCLSIGMPVPNSLFININVQKWDKVGRGTNSFCTFWRSKKILRIPSRLLLMSYWPALGHMVLLKQSLSIGNGITKIGLINP